MTKAEKDRADKIAKAKAAQRVKAQTAAENAPTPKEYRHSIIRIRGQRAERERKG